MLGGALRHLVPRSSKAHGGPSVQAMLLVVVGLAGLSLLEKMLCVHHHHPSNDAPSPATGAPRSDGWGG